MLYRGLVAKMIGASILDLRLYRQVKEDKTDTVEALKIVVIAALAFGIANILSSGDALSGGNVKNLLDAVIWGPVAWAVRAWAILKVGTVIFKNPEMRINFWQIARTTGFAQSPAILRSFLFVPYLDVVLFICLGLWQFVTSIVAVQVTFDYRSTWRALWVVLIGFSLSSLAIAILKLVIGGPLDPSDF